MKVKRFLSIKNFAKVMLVSTAICLALIMTEFSLRTIYKLRYGYHYYPWPPYLSRNIHIIPGVFPNLSGTKRFYINSIGMRGDEAKSQDNYRIVTIGGSTTENGELDENETWPKLLQDKLNQPSPVGIWVGNAARRGSTLRDNILQMKYYVSQIKKVDAVIVLPGINDFMLAISNVYSPFDPDSINHPTVSQLDHAFSVYPYTHYGIKGTATWSLLKQMKITLFGRKIVDDNEGNAEMYWRSQRQKAKNTLNETPSLTAGISEFKKNLNLIVDLSEAKNQRVILLTQPSIYKEIMSEEELKLLWFGCVELNGWTCYSPKALKEGLDEFNQATLEVCQERQLECIDLANKVPKNTAVFIDDVHFNVNGTQIISTIVADYLKSKIPLSHISKNVKQDL